MNLHPYSGKFELSFMSQDSVQQLVNFLTGSQLACSELERAELLDIEVLGPRQAKLWGKQADRAAL